MALAAQSSTVGQRVDVAVSGFELGMVGFIQKVSVLYSKPEFVIPSLPLPHAFKKPVFLKKITLLWVLRVGGFS